MKTTLFVLIASLGFATSSSALDIAAITAKPTADNPQYDDKEAWPDLVGDEYFTKQEWPKTRLLIWGKADTRPTRENPLEPMNPANWIDAATGKPADALPDMNTDVILPDSDTKYIVQPRGNRDFECRHLTIGRNASFLMTRHDVFGNLWIRPRGKMLSRNTLFLKGEGDTFLRQDWPEDGKLKKWHLAGARQPFDIKNPKAVPWRALEEVMHFFVADKPGATVETVGAILSQDEITVFPDTTFIVGRDSRVHLGLRGNIWIRPKATIALMDGAMMSSVFNRPSFAMHKDATLSGGLPDRPLRRDALAGVPYLNWMRLKFPKTIQPYINYGGFGAWFRGKVIGYPATGTDARLVIGWSGIGSEAWGIFPPPGKRGDYYHKTWNKVESGYYKLYGKLQPKITIWGNHDTQIENVRFDDLHRGRLMLTDAEVFKNWKNVSFGDGCLSKDPKELLRELPRELRIWPDLRPPKWKETWKLPVEEKYITP